MPPPPGAAGTSVIMQSRFCFAQLFGVDGCFARIVIGAGAAGATGATGAVAGGGVGLTAPGGDAATVFVGVVAGGGAPVGIGVVAGGVVAGGEAVDPGAFDVVLLQPPSGGS